MQDDVFLDETGHTIFKDRYSITEAKHSRYW